MFPDNFRSWCPVKYKSNIWLPRTIHFPPTPRRKPTTVLLCIHSVFFILCQCPTAPTSGPLFSSVAPAGYSNININDWKKLSTRWTMEENSSFPLPIVPCMLPFILSPASPRYKEASAASLRRRELRKATERRGEVEHCNPPVILRTQYHPDLYVRKQRDGFLTAKQSSQRLFTPRFVQILPS